MNPNFGMNEVKSGIIRNTAYTHAQLRVEGEHSRRSHRFFGDQEMLLTASQLHSRLIAELVHLGECAVLLLGCCSPLWKFMLARHEKWKTFRVLPAISAGINHYYTEAEKSMWYLVAICDPVYFRFIILYEVNFLFLISTAFNCYYTWSI